MKVAIFDTHKFELAFFTKANQDLKYDLHFFDVKLTPQTASMADGFEVVCAFVNDNLKKEVLQILAAGGTKLIALRSAGYNHVDLESANKLGLKVVRVPEYSPYAVAEHAVALLMTLNRKIHKAYNRTREGNFSLDGLIGFDLNKKTVGVIGTGKIGQVFAQIMLGFGAQVLAYDLTENGGLTQKGVQYVSLVELIQKSDIISLHVPLNTSTFHLINGQRLSQTKKGLILINTSRGALVETKSLIASLKSGHLGGAALDVYEEEEGVFFSDLSGEVLQDDVLARLLTFPNVLITSHQAFLTEEALTNIAETTLENIRQYKDKNELKNKL
jgi:D-lactate dehydrogenase